ncbi:GNAT family N-acetyltransferase [Kitasatospora sp. GP82]|uniref:GNAT family N-acetyltransferase n=1 Tax=Kitasatospora sp. GP82 TaxID=3035089 RepID=UPI0024747563|nr:GNAT family N-acetyltransferase [Kitasatospora sp. GP82]MDH6126840.1 GNAT superfamily N-acetyltransferase [Kitasatospora sp. GP82]
MGGGHYAAHSPEEDAAWRHGYRQWLERVLLREDQRIHVAACGAATALRACAIAVIDDRAPTAHCLTGQVGWVQTVVVDPASRRQGLGVRVMAYVLDWLRVRGVQQVALQTTTDGAGLYRNLGFRPTGEDLLTLDLRGV